MLPGLQLDGGPASNLGIADGLVGGLNGRFVAGVDGVPLVQLVFEPGRNRVAKRETRRRQLPLIDQATKMPVGVAVTLFQVLLPKQPPSLLETQNNQSPVACRRTPPAASLPESNVDLVDRLGLFAQSVASSGSARYAASRGPKGGALLLLRAARACR